MKNFPYTSESLSQKSVHNKEFSLQIIKYIHMTYFNILLERLGQ